MPSTMGSGEDGQAPVAAARTPGEDLERIDDAESAGIQRRNRLARPVVPH